MVVIPIVAAIVPAVVRPYIPPPWIVPAILPPAALVDGIPAASLFRRSA